MGRYLDLRQSVVLGGSEAEAARLDRAAAEVARACGGKLPGIACSPRRWLAATAEEPEESSEQQQPAYVVDARRKIVVYLT